MRKSSSTRSKRKQKTQETKKVMKKICSKQPMIPGDLSMSQTVVVDLVLA
jgi:hypothetical protein